MCDFDADMKVVALPTIQKHIRQRGFDHMGKLAKCLAQRNGLEIAKALERGNNCVQVGADVEKRREQAKTAYMAKGGIDVNANYLLIDDV